MVLYVLDEVDVEQINCRRTNDGSIKARLESGTWPPGAQAHVGNAAKVGDICPAVAIRVWQHNDKPPVNLQVLLDGSDTYWATSRHEDESKSPGTWHWPTRE